MSFDPAVWGTVSSWVGALLTGLSVLAAAIYYVCDRQRARRKQANSVLVWLHPHEHGPPMLKIQNLSGKPVFDHRCVIVSKTERQIAELAGKGWTNSGPFKWPTDNKLTYRGGHTFLNYHDGSELYLADGQKVEHLAQLEFNPAVYDYYAAFRDASGQYWAVNARTQRLVKTRKRRALGIGRGGLDAT
ncbi:hypothetical protein [Mycobacterium avium]|uniref:hypothetical protein n=1 Tax=Mycobacterium avium TaxID=1764 RepID=UPI001070F231|nr:hypothetical protein [Mycobacterium avium]